MNNVVITGATSFIGLSLARLLSERDCNVFAIVRPGSSRIELLPKASNITMVESELNELRSLESVLPKCDALFHIAWSSDFPDPRFNLGGQLLNAEYAVNAAELARELNCDVFLGIGSQAECGRVNGCISVNTPFSPETAYAVAKVVAYNRVKEVCRDSGMKLCWPRLLSAYGPYDRMHTMVMSCIRAGLERRSMDLTRGEQIWDYVYVDDVSRALYAIAMHGKHDVKYPIGSGTAHSLRSYIEIIAQKTGGTQLLEGIGKRAYADRQVMNLLADISDLAADTGFTPQTEFENGIDNTIQYVRNLLTL